MNGSTYSSQCTLHIYSGKLSASSGWAAIMILLVHARYAAAMYTGWNQRASGNTEVFLK